MANLRLVLGLAFILPCLPQIAGFNIKIREVGTDDAGDTIPWETVALTKGRCHTFDDFQSPGALDDLPGGCTLYAYEDCKVPITKPLMVKHNEQLRRNGVAALILSNSPSDGALYSPKLFVTVKGILCP